MKKSASYLRGHRKATEYYKAIIDGYLTPQIRGLNDSLQDAQRQISTLEAKVTYFREEAYLLRQQNEGLFEFKTPTAAEPTAPVKAKNRLIEWVKKLVKI